MIKCPKCNSEQITSQKKGFGFGKALAGIFVAGPVGLIAGAVGANKIQVHCLNCGNKWLPKKSTNTLNKTITTSGPRQKPIKTKNFSKDKTEEERRREIYEKTGLSASDPKFGNFRSTKKRK